MKVHAITVCVDYSVELSRSIDRWIASLETLVVVTTPRDESTISLAEWAGAKTFLTEAFYEDHAFFNKGRALERGRTLLPADGWHLFLDADVIPPGNWMEVVEAQSPEPGALYGARRVTEGGEPIRDAELAGFFQLFHSSDPKGWAPLEQDFLHAGNFDSAFIARWPRNARRFLDLELVHLGEPRVNWCGKSEANRQALRGILEGRRHRSWRHERVRS